MLSWSSSSAHSRTCDISPKIGNPLGAQGSRVLWLGRVERKGCLPHPVHYACKDALERLAVILSSPSYYWCSCVYNAPTLGDIYHMNFENPSVPMPTPYLTSNFTLLIRAEAKFLSHLMGKRSIYYWQPTSIELSHMPHNINHFNELHPFKKLNYAFNHKIWTNSKTSDSIKGHNMKIKSYSSLTLSHISTFWISHQNLSVHICYIYFNIKSKIL